jgi:hypothetical protein
MKLSRKIWRSLVLTSILFGGLVLVIVLTPPTVWLYDWLAVEVAFGRERAAREHITVEYITKPSTVTFSNGERIDVGLKPAVVSTIFRIGATALLLVCYGLLVMRCGPKWFRIASTGRWDSEA